ncbi:sensor histidine kinase [Paenibacillus hamazuiensis]|uniref:sensor histidine kinase n=1 Tax=Paenibacillus hamazuiensis TaxID=2936508 RepID=UPI00200C4F5E|nr:HAMP domain-containing sensor histidine kinase [Paenibacillus hamazuiensis]
MKKPRFRYRFTFFWRQFLSHLLVSLLVFTLLSGGFIYYYQGNIYNTEAEELVSAGRAIARLIQKEDEDPTSAIAAYRSLLAERKISFIILDKSGDVVYRDPKMAGNVRTKPFLDGLRSHIFTIKDNQSFLLENGGEKMIVVPRLIRLKAQNKELFLFVLTSHRGIPDILQSLKEPFLYMSGVVALLAVVVSLFISRNLSRSIRSLQQATNRIAQGDLAARSPVRRSDELGELSGDFNAMADRLEETSRKLQQFEARRRQFITDVSHELRTPLTSIRGIVEGLKNNLVTGPEDTQKYYGIIEKETFRLIRLINELLDMEKIENGLITLQKRSSPLRELLEVVAESLEVLVSEKKLHLIVDCPPELAVYGDYDRLMQILINLAKNSIQFTDYGTVRLTGSETERMTRIDIADTGKGMTMEEQSYIWERFYKADPSRSKNKSETGLGLSIVKRLVEAHGGTITVESAPGMGTTFTILLPKEETAPSAALPHGG